MLDAPAFAGLLGAADAPCVGGGTVAVAVTLWVIASPARASEPLVLTGRAVAPLCDDLGATRAAPPPTLRLEETTLDVASSEETCAEDLAAALLTDAPNRESSAQVGGSLFRSTLRATLLVGASAPSSELARHAIESNARRGIRLRVERPPRS